MSSGSAPATMTEPPLQGVRTIAVTAVKGGVGKTVVSATLARAIAEFNSQVIALDAQRDWGTLSDLLGARKRAPIDETQDLVVTQSSHPGLRVVRSKANADDNLAAPVIEAGDFIKQVTDIYPWPDFLICDTPPGLSAHSKNCINACSEIVVIVSDDPGSLRDAAMQIRVLNRNKRTRFYILPNGVRGLFDGHRLYHYLNKALEDVDVVTSLLGVIPWDRRIAKATQQGRTVIDAGPVGSLPSVKTIARILHNRFWGDDVRGNICFFPTTDNVTPA